MGGMEGTEGMGGIEGVEGIHCCLDFGSSTLSTIVGSR